MADMYKVLDGVRVKMTAEEIAEKERLNEEYENNKFNIVLSNLRKERNSLLKETDWMANSDVTMSNDWITYRQQLRDLPSGLDTVEKVEAVEFPTKPSGE